MSGTYGFAVGRPTGARVGDLTGFSVGVVTGEPPLTHLPANNS